jgi:hypothetical protein
MAFRIETDRDAICTTTLQDIFTAGAQQIADQKQISATIVYCRKTIVE